jgi:hypothetical protein
MSWLKKGPNLKLSEVKVPDFLYDLYYDLKERRLLPLVALLLVAIVAVPIALGQASSNSEEPEEAVEAPIAGSSGASSGSLVVAKSAPGLRDYRRRLEHARALDPFEQQYAGTGASETSGEATPEGETSAGLEEAPIPFEASGGGIESSGGGGSAIQGDAKYASNSIDVRIVSVPSGDDDGASSAKPKAEVRRDLPELTMLPSRETPAATFMGTSADGKKVLVLVSSDVQSIFGDGQCVVGSKTCQLLALDIGLPETFVYGPQGRTYRIEILRIEKTLSSKPRRAPLGIPKQSKDEENQGAGTDPDSKPEAESPAATG